VYVAAEHRRMGGASALLSAAEEHARSLGLTRLFLDTRHDLEEARAFYAASGFDEVPPFSAPGQFKDHWFQKTLT
jgi:GNAT superfamily N-acetyltransferase